MSEKPIIPREQARRDIEDAIDHYANDAGAEVALGFIDAVQAAFRGIGRHPAAGSPRYAHELNLPELRSRLLRRYPYLIFYVERDDHIDIWRVLHAHQDIPVWMQEPPDR